jgi:uncharacterized protein (DUF58 family)
MWSALYIGRRFYAVLIVVVLMCVIGVFVPVSFILGLVTLALLAGLTTYDYLQLFRRSDDVTIAERTVADHLSNGDENAITLTLIHHYPFQCTIEVIDEVPVQFQARDLSWKMSMDSGVSKRIEYKLRPVERGAYVFGNLYVYVESPLRLIRRRFAFDANTEVKVYPSYLQLKKFAFLAFDKRLQIPGQKRMRRLGHTTEFEHIKTYVPGDDTRTINWKATARTGVAMVNQFRDERAQPIYCVIDKGRLMQMPFKGLSLLDYAINATLVLSYIAIRKEDHAGVITFEKQVDDMVIASRQNNQMYRISETLYKQETGFLEADFERLYIRISRNVGQRSLMLLFTNFESLQGFRRQLPYFRKIAEKHLLVVIFFENTELDGLIHKKVTGLREIYHQTIGEKMIQEKEGILGILRQHGIHGILCPPEDLTVQTINKYLEMKSSGML